ncbi:hypothetical protein ABZW44_38455 [Streptomyces mirabilis]|uniref:hypothetical protein n=1 Tax=Streptomyces TaxID=1883 RepID=UPI00117F28A6|nr:hypothetical protein [Streptomyces sp. Ag82_O1-15]
MAELTSLNIPPDAMATASHAEVDPVAEREHPGEVRPAWDRDDLEDAVLERGFAAVEDFLASARSFYPYDKAHPDTGPHVLRTAAGGDGAWSRQGLYRADDRNDP